MKVKEIDVVALKVDVPELGLKAGDTGTVVHIHPYGEIEVEFVDTEGGLLGLLQVDPELVRKPTASELKQTFLPHPGEPWMERLENGRLWVRPQPAR
jgi:hypothetical protein